MEGPYGGPEGNVRRPNVDEIHMRGAVYTLSIVDDQVAQGLYRMVGLKYFRDCDCY